MSNNTDDTNKVKRSLVDPIHSSKNKKGFANELRRLIITVGLFLVMQLIFIVIDGTFLEPNFNRMGNFASGLAKNDFFKNWFILYDNPIFKLITAVAILHIIYVLIKTTIIGCKEKNTRLD